MYANSIVKEAGWGEDIKDSAKAGLGVGASGDGIWKFIRSLIVRYQDTGIVKHLLSGLARSRVENELFKTPGNYIKMLGHGSFYNKVPKPKNKGFFGNIANSISNAASDYLVKSTPEHDKYRDVLSSIDTKGWGFGPEAEAAARESFGRQWDAPNSKVRDASHQYLKDNLFSTWDQPQINPLP